MPLHSLARPTSLLRCSLCLSLLSINCLTIGKTSDSSLRSHQELRTRKEGLCRVSSANKTSYSVVAGSKIISVFSPLFSLPVRKILLRMGWSGRFYILVFTWVRVPPVGRGPTENIQLPGFQAWSLLWFTSVFWKHTGGAWIETHSRAVWNSDLFLSLFCLFCVPPLFTSPLVLIPALLPRLPWTFVWVFKFCGWHLCAAVLCVQLLLQVSANTVGTIEHFSLEIHSPRCLRLQPWVTEWNGILKKRQELEHFPPLLLQWDYSAWALRTAWFISSPPDWGKIRKKAILNSSRKAW